MSRKIWISYEGEYTKLKIDTKAVEDIDDLRQEIVKHLQLNCPVVNIKLERGDVALLDPSAPIPQGFTTIADALHVFVGSTERKKKYPKKKVELKSTTDTGAQTEAINEKKKELQERKVDLDADAKSLESKVLKERAVRKQFKSEMETLLSQIRMLHESEKQLKDQIRNLQRAWRPPNEEKLPNSEGGAEGEEEFAPIEGPVAAAPGGPPAASTTKKKKKKKNKKRSRNTQKGEEPGACASVGGEQKQASGLSKTDMQINELHKQREEHKAKRAILFEQYKGVKEVDNAVATKVAAVSSQMRRVEKELKQVNQKLENL